MARFYLLFSAAGLTLVALSYGVAPADVLPRLMDVNVEGTDLTHIFRAVMGLYLGGRERSADSGDSLWLTMNRVQENLVRGGLRGRSSTGRRVRTRAIHSVQEDVRPVICPDIG